MISPAEDELNKKNSRIQNVTNMADWSKSNGCFPWTYEGAYIKNLFGIMLYGNGKVLVVCLVKRHRGNSKMSTGSVTCQLNVNQEKTVNN